MKTEIVTIIPSVFEDKANGIFIVMDGNNEGGAIISNPDLDVAMSKFKEASQVENAFRNLLGFVNKTDTWYKIEFSK